MTCGWWIVADGNNRIGLTLRKNPEATIADIPKGLLALARYGEWDSKEPRSSRRGFCKPRGNVPPLRYGLPFLPALPSGASWQIFVK
jgi:hypothetical protein